MLVTRNFSNSIYNPRLFSFHSNLSIPISKKHLSNISKNYSYRDEVDLSFGLITHRTSVINDKEFFFKIEQAIKGRITYIQLRDRREDYQDCLKTAFRLKDMLRGTGISLIINDYVDIALAVKAGVHLGQSDLDVSRARSILGDEAIIGLTVETIGDVCNAERLDIDYLGLQVFQSLNTKPNHSRLWGIEGVKTVRSISDKRLVVLGGVKYDNLEIICSSLQLGKKGDGIAMVGELWRGKDPYDVAQKIRAIIDKITKK